VPISQFTLLFILSKHTALNQKELSSIAKLEKSSLHRNIKRLIDHNYVSRKVFPLLQLTNDGKKLVNAIIPEWKKAMAEIRKIIGKDGELFIHQIHQI
jgi:DNA-binding MarR family transcriptional regulator